MYLHCTQNFIKYILYLLLETRTQNVGKFFYCLVIFQQKYSVTVRPYVVYRIIFLYLPTYW